MKQKFYLLMMLGMSINSAVLRYVGEDFQTQEGGTLVNGQEIEQIKDSRCTDLTPYFEWEPGFQKTIKELYWKLSVNSHKLLTYSAYRYKTSETFDDPILLITDLILRNFEYISGCRLSNLRKAIKKELKLKSLTELLKILKMTHYLENNSQFFFVLVGCFSEDLREWLNRLFKFFRCEQNIETKKKMIEFCDKENIDYIIGLSLDLIDSLEKALVFLRGSKDENEEKSDIVTLKQKRLIRQNYHDFLNNNQTDLQEINPQELVKNFVMIAHLMQFEFCFKLLHEILVEVLQESKIENKENLIYLVQNDMYGFKIHQILNDYDQLAEKISCNTKLIEMMNNYMKYRSIKQIATAAVEFLLLQYEYKRLQDQLPCKLKAFEEELAASEYFVLLCGRKRIRDLDDKSSNDNLEEEDILKSQIGKKRSRDLDDITKLMYPTKVRNFSHKRIN